MKSPQSPQRDHYINFLRGIAAISVVWIHVCFWSGAPYVPEVVQTLSLAIDVPFFFFLSGWASTYVNSFEKSINSLLTIYKKYVMFLPLYVVALLIYGAFTGDYPGLTLRNLYANLFFFTEEPSAISAVMGSMWFMPVYFTVVPIGRFISTKLFSGGRTPLLITGIALLYSWWTGSFFHIASNTLFYLFFFFLGIVCKETKINKFRTVFLFCIVDIGVMKLIGIYCGWDISNMQSMKFPPSVIYLLYSLLWISVTLWLKNWSEKISANNIFCKIGRSAIYFYFCQGISSSLLLYLMPKVEIFWVFKLVLAFLLNLSGTLCLVFILNQFYKIEEHLFVRLKHFALNFVKKID